jgi:sec-independent protein translocase protein TatB
MLDVGFSEILLTSAIALIVLGPERLPKVARQVGNWMGRARAMARQLSEQLEREVSADELMKAQNKPSTGSPGSPTAAALHDAAPPPPDPVVVEPTYGRPASETTAAAMHASDPPADPIPPHE